MVSFDRLLKKAEADNPVFPIHGSNQRTKQNLLLNDRTITAVSAEADFPNQCFQNRSFQLAPVFKRTDVSQSFLLLPELLRKRLG